jgi:hypothetical protein
MTPQEALAAYLKAVGERLSERIAALWPNLDDEQRAAIEAQTTEDGLRALLDAYEAGRRQPIYRTVFQVEVFTEGPYELPAKTDWLAQINWDITSGPWIGNVERSSGEVIPAAQVREHMLRIGNDGNFFDEADG